MYSSRAIGIHRSTAYRSVWPRRREAWSSRRVEYPPTKVDSLGSASREASIISPDRGDDELPHRLGPIPTRYYMPSTATSECGTIPVQSEDLTAECSARSAPERNKQYSEEPRTGLVTFRAEGVVFSNGWGTEGVPPASPNYIVPKPS